MTQVFDSCFILDFDPYETEKVMTLSDLIVAKHECELGRTFVPFSRDCKH